MKKFGLILFPFIASLLAGCDAINNIFNKNSSESNLPPIDFKEGKSLDNSVKKGALGDFSLVAPGDGTIVDEQPTFTWTASENALFYNLEVCSSESFNSTSTSIVYTKETNIAATSFKLSANLAQKNVTYYWRVTAVNEYNTRSMGKEKVSSVSTFFYKIESVGEIEIGVGEAEDWALHKAGSVADISIDHNDFFGTGNDDSLVISFEKEKTLNGQPGIENSRGWIVVQKAVEKDFYGTDAFFCNFYFMGHDSTILIRVIDQDGELWYKQVKFTMDARQMALLRFDEFILRTGDTVVQNEVFNYEHIQAIEVCFERTFGDGCCVVGGIKAVNYENYKDWFIEKLDFNCLPVTEWTFESYNFETTISEDGNELTLGYSPLNGYGFAKIPVKRYFGDGNAIRVKVKYSGYSDSKVNAIIRIYEPDKDRWSYTQPYSTLTKDEYVELTIPFMAFEQSSIVEGKRQFYYIENLQFGLNNCYSTGTISYKDFEIIEVPSVSTNPRHVGLDGIIDNFDNYLYRGEAYQQWETSVENKDEGIFLSTDDRFNDGYNLYAGKFTYKSDMSMAKYDIYTEVEATGLNALKFWIKDASVPNTAATGFQDYKGEDVSPTVALQVAFEDGRLYQYVIEKAPRIWTEYIIPFEDFTLYQGRVYDDSDPLESQFVKNFGFGMQYFYYRNADSENPIANPLYTQNNPVFMDNIMFVSSETTQINDLEVPLHPDANGVTKVDDFEYLDQFELSKNWFGLNGLDYENYELSDDVSSSGGTHSMKLDYKGSSSPSYATYPTVGSDVESKAISLDIKGDGVATVYINFYLRVNSTTIHQYRHTISNVTSGWNHYVIGFGTSLWTAMTSGAGALGKTSMQSLHRLTFGVTGGSGAEVKSIYIDNINFELSPAYSTNTVTPLG